MTSPHKRKARLTRMGLHSPSSPPPSCLTSAHQMREAHRKARGWPPAHPDEGLRPEWGCIIILLLGIACWATLGWIVYTNF